MNVSASVQSREGQHEVGLSTNGNSHALGIVPKTTGQGSSVNGGELLFLALATCYCNDIYREAAKRGIRVESVEVEMAGEFGTKGEPATNVRYHTKIAAHASEEAIRLLASDTDHVAEIQNSLRASIPITLSDVEVVAL